MKSQSSKERYEELAGKWLNNTISAQEKEEFVKWYNTEQEKEVHLDENFASNDEALKARIFLTIEKRISRNSRSAEKLTQAWYWAAAAIIVILSTGLYFYVTNPHTDQLVLKHPHPASVRKGSLNQARPAVNEKDFIANQDIAPGKDKATLTLVDGKKIILDDAKNGILANQSGTNILKTANGELIYLFSETNPNAEVYQGIENMKFNIIETPKGGKFQVKLPDGTKIWLNAASSLRFPASFNGPKRTVELTGEAYFEVAHDENRIFEVITRDQTVQVLGTHFNINAYDNEPSVNTTLLEGSVRISDLRTNHSQLLKPGEQAKLSEKMEVINIENVSETVAWKDGYFQFNDADIQTVMRQIGRWYDVTVRYEEGMVPSHRFKGEIERNLSLLQVLKILEKTKVHFRLEGKEVIVMR